VLKDDKFGHGEAAWLMISNPRALSLRPYPCDKSFFRYCKAATATSKTGSTIYVGAPIGTAQALAVPLNGKAPPVNECRE
jgi:hypothetical protein